MLLRILYLFMQLSIWVCFMPWAGFSSVINALREVLLDFTGVPWGDCILLLCEVWFSGVQLFIQNLVLIFGLCSKADITWLFANGCRAQSCTDGHVSVIGAINAVSKCLGSVEHLVAWRAHRFKTKSLYLSLHCLLHFVTIICEFFYICDDSRFIALRKSLGFETTSVFCSSDVGAAHWARLVLCWCYV